MTYSTDRHTMLAGTLLLALGLAAGLITAGCQPTELDDPDTSEQDTGAASADTNSSSDDTDGTSDASDATDAPDATDADTYEEDTGANGIQCETLHPQWNAIVSKSEHKTCTKNDDCVAVGTRTSCSCNARFVGPGTPVAVNEKGREQLTPLIHKYRGCQGNQSYCDGSLVDNVLCDEGTCKVELRGCLQLDTGVDTGDAGN